MKTNFLSKSNSFNNFNQVVHFLHGANCDYYLHYVKYLYSKTKEYRLQIFVVYNNAKPSLGIFIIIFWMIFYLLGN